MCEQVKQPGINLWVGRFQRGGGAGTQVLLNSELKLATQLVYLCLLKFSMILTIKLALLEAVLRKITPPKISHVSETCIVERELQV